MATLTSININGLRDKIKMKELLFTFRSDIICIQETNWEEDKVKEMREEWKGDIYYNNEARNARGVAILIKKDRVESIVGDFNIKCSRLDVGKGVKFRWEKSRGMLMEIIRDKGLIDVWRYENPEKREFTRKQSRKGILKQSRIDLVLAK